MSLSEEQKEHAVHLIEVGEQLEAVRYLQEKLNITTEQAVKLAEKLEEEAEADQNAIKTELRAKLEDFKRRSATNPGVNVGRLVGSIFMVLGSIMLSVVVYITYSNYQFSKRAIPVRGIVLEYNSYYSTDSDGGGSTMFTPTFEYSYNGRKYTYTSNTSSSSKEYNEGDEVEVLVDPDDPDSVLVNAFWERWFLVVLLGFMGSMFTGLGYMAYAVLGKTR